MHVLQFESLLSSAATLVLLALTAWAFVDAMTRRAEVFLAASKLSKPAWLLLLGLALGVVLLFGGFSIFGFAAIVIMLVYFLDVRPALAELTRRR